MAEENSVRDPGEVPVLDWIDKSAIDADTLYQRPLDENRVASILAGFSWRSFGALVLVPHGDGRYAVTDGQHRLEAAKRHPLVQHVPAVIVQAEDISAEAGVFVAVNRNRKNVSALELFFAQLAAGDADALDIQQVCQRAGIRVPKYPVDYKPGDSIAVSAIGVLIKNVGVMRARQYLEILTGFAPITGMHVKAVEHLLTDKEFADQVQIEDVAAAIKTMGDGAVAEAKRFAATHRVTSWKGLASVWFQKTRKRKAPATPVSEKPTFEADDSRVSAKPIHRVAEKPTGQPRYAPIPVSADPRSLTGRIAGDPEPGRSALDQRRAG